MTYELSYALHGHREDVLGLTVTLNDHIVSCSRDKTAKLWLPEDSAGKYALSETYLAEQLTNTKFLTCVCAIPPNNMFKKGLVATGGSDSNILIFEPDSAVPFQQLCGHKNNVCKLVNSIEENVILSASWDTTVKIWRILPQGWKCAKTLQFPGTSVWAILHTKRNLICAGTADKTIRIFSEDYKLLRSLLGHEDCVRDLVEVNDEEILSCSNDSTIRRWSILTGVCLEILYGHPNFIYSVRIFDDLIVSSGEDRCILIWSKGCHLQTINIPARSVWTVAFLSNRDIVVGSSDGVIRIFTTATERLASREILDAFRKACSNLVVPFKKYKGRSKNSRFPESDDLTECSIQDGSKKIVQDNNEIFSYSRSLGRKKWEKLEPVDDDALKFSKNLTVYNDPKRISPAPIRVRNVFVCAICGKSFSKKYILRRHFRKTNHSIANKIPACLRTVLPKEWHYYVCKFKRKVTDYKAEICLTTINTAAEVHEWIRKFCDQNKQTYRRYSTKRSNRGLTAYVEFYKCYFANAPRKLKKRRTNERGCKSSIHFAIRRGPLGSGLCKSYTKLNLNLEHNHSLHRVSRVYKRSVEVEEKGRAVSSKAGSSPMSVLKTQVLTHENCSSTSIPDHNASSKLNFVKSHDGCSNINNIDDEVINNAKEELDTAKFTAQLESVLHCVEAREANIEEEATYIEYILPDVEDMVAEVEIEPDSDDEVDDKQLLKKLRKRFDNFIVKLEEDDVRYFKTGILSMCNELKKACQASAQNRLSALLSFSETGECR